MFVSSAEKKRGRDEILEFIEKTMLDFKVPANLKKKNPYNLGLPNTPAFFPK